jgi:hypothetical protein
MCSPMLRGYDCNTQPVGEKTADLVGQDGVAAVPTTALDPPLVRLLLQSRRLYRSRSLLKPLCGDFTSQ